MKLLSIVSALLLAGAAWAQESPSYHLKEHVLNSGGDPRGGVSLASASYRVSLDAVGDGLSLVGVSGPSFKLDAGFVSAYPPPGEVTGVLFDDDQTFHWNPESSVGDYNVYRDLVSSLSGLAFGACLESEVATASTTDAASPASGSGYFYLVTAENRLDEEGTKGLRSNGAERANAAPCP